MIILPRSLKKTMLFSTSSTKCSPRVLFDTLPPLLYLPYTVSVSALRIPTISVTRPSTHITETTTTSQQKVAAPPTGYPYPPPGVYPSPSTTYYQHPQPAPPYPQAVPPYGVVGAHGHPPPYDGYHQQPAYNPGFQPGPGDVATPM